MNDACEISHTELNWLVDDASHGTLSSDENRSQIRRSTPTPYGSVWVGGRQDARFRPSSAGNCVDI